MVRRKLEPEEIKSALADLPGWQLLDGRLHKTFKFASFARAMGWMTSVAIVADKMDHHPEWSNVYNRVTVDLMTHDLGNVVSSWDVELARQMEGLTA
ncbi:MAG: 4a-hydroxytetrahydrobiopterin dehydratase [Ardenticatenaceae bacterium]|nr:4a-hydroxytetrahydrobiopterin dehydratase [Ardenticatenaceae bacterium]MCB9444503.1 4a-hydroxytetrahydrobiopterin dehydratase [Ardenticatenaceae bacterium]